MVVKGLRLTPLQGIPSERVRKIRDKMLSMPRELDLEFARYPIKLRFFRN